MAMTISAREMTDIYAEHAAIERMCSGNGVTLHWIDPRDKNQTPHADLKKRTIHLPQLQPGYSETDRKLHRAVCWHENGHLDPSQDGMLPMMEREKVDMRTYLGKALNAVNDNWQEQIQSLRYAGAASDLDFMAAFYAKKGADGFAAGKLVDDEFMGKLLTWHYLCRAEWQTGVSLFASEWAKYYHLPAAWLELIPRANNICDTDDPAAENLAIAKLLMETDPEAPEEQDSPDGEGDKSEDSDNNDGEGEGEAGKISYKDLMAHDHSEVESGDPYGASSEIEYDHKPLRDYIPAGPDEFYIGRPTGKRVSPREKLFTLEGLNNDRAETAQVSGGIRRLFQSESQTKRVGLQKRGRLTGKDLARLPTGEDRIFHKKISRLAGVADVYTLVDASGSMMGDKYHAACNAAIALAEALSAANIPNKVAAFTEQYEKVEHYIIKDWKEPAVYETMRDYFSDIDLYDNADGDNIMQAVRELLPQPNKRKVLLVMSDGMPCTSRPGDCHTFTKQAIQHAMAKGIEVYGLGIMTRHVSGMFPNWAYVKRTSDIEAALVKIVTDTLLEKGL